MAVDVRQGQRVGICLTQIAGFFIDAMGLKNIVLVITDTDV